MTEEDNITKAWAKLMGSGFENRHKPKTRFDHEKKIFYVDGFMLSDRPLFYLATLFKDGWGLIAPALISAGYALEIGGYGYRPDQTDKRSDRLCAQLLLGVPNLVTIRVHVLLDNNTISKQVEIIDGVEKLGQLSGEERPLKRICLCSQMMKM